MISRIIKVEVSTPSTPSSQLCWTISLVTVNSMDGPVAQWSVRQPCGIGGQFDNVVYVRDATPGTVNIISPLTSTVKFLGAVGDLCSGFSVHDKGNAYETCNLQTASELVHNCRVFLEKNEQAISDHELPKTLNGPRWNVAGNSVELVPLVELGLNRLNKVTKQFRFNEANLLSCMTLDVEQFHLTTYVKMTSCPCCSISAHLETV